MFNITVIIWKKIMNMGKTNKCNLRKDETIEEVANACMRKVLHDAKKETTVRMLGKVLRKRLVLKKVVIVNF